MASPMPELDPRDHGPVPEFAVSWIGKPCRVWLTEDGHGYRAVLLGTLVDVNQWGEGVVDTDEGRRYVWPVLRIEAASCHAG